MRITVNGTEREVAADASILDVIESLGLNPKTVVTQRNEEIVERGAYADIKLCDGDALELVRMVGGG